MSIFNRKRIGEWRAAVKSSKEGRLALWVKLAMHIPKMRVGMRVWFKRMKTCGRCPIYHPHKKTCGHDPEINSVGCGCYMPFKACSQRATCWARDNNLILGEKQVGWGDDINDISDMKDTRTCHTAKPLYKGSGRG